MKIDEIELNSFRNHHKLILKNLENLNIIVGPNGVGKTNILEAIYLLATTKSFRAKEDQDMIMFEKSYTSVTAKILKDKFSDILECRIIKENDITSKRAFINLNRKSMSDFAGTLLSVLFTPKDLNIFQGTPSDRRLFMDLTLIQTSQMYKKNLVEYSKVLKSRNALFRGLKEKPANLDILPYWDEKLVTLSDEIQLERIDFAKYISQKLTKQFNYLKSEINLEKLKNNRYKEINAKTTLYGAHRDDFEVLSQDKDMRHFSSRGQQRTTVLELKTIELDYIEEKTKQRPILLLDDIFSELDDLNRNYVFDLSKKQQTFITSAHKEFVLEGANLIKL